MRCKWWFGWHLHQVSLHQRASLRHLYDRSRHISINYKSRNTGNTATYYSSNSGALHRDTTYILYIPYRDFCSACFKLSFAVVILMWSLFVAYSKTIIENTRKLRSTHLLLIEASHLHSLHCGKKEKIGLIKYMYSIIYIQYTMHQTIKSVQDIQCIMDTL